MWRRPSRCRSKATTWWWISNPSSFRGAPLWREPGIHTPDRGYGFRARRFAAPRNDEELNVPHRPPLPRVAHQSYEAIDAMHEFSVGHGDEQREHHAEMQRE